MIFHLQFESCVWLVCFRHTVTCRICMSLEQLHRCCKCKFCVVMQPVDMADSTMDHQTHDQSQIRYKFATDEGLRMGPYSPCVVCKKTLEDHIFHVSCSFPNQACFGVRVCRAAGSPRTFFFCMRAPRALLRPFSFRGRRRRTGCLVGSLMSHPNSFECRARAQERVLQDAGLRFFFASPCVSVFARVYELSMEKCILSGQCFGFVMRDAHALQQHMQQHVCRQNRLCFLDCCMLHMYICDRMRVRITLGDHERIMGDHEANEWGSWGIMKPTRGIMEQTRGIMGDHGGS